MISKAAEYARSWMRSAQEAAQGGKTLNYCMKFKMLDFFSVQFNSEKKFTEGEGYDQIPLFLFIS